MKRFPSLDVGCWMFNPPSPSIPCPPVNGCRIQTALPPGSPAPAGAVLQPAGANGRLAAQTPTLGGPHHYWLRRPILGNPSGICQLSLWIKTAARQAIDQPRPHHLRGQQHHQRQSGASQGLRLAGRLPRSLRPGRPMECHAGGVLVPERPAGSSTASQSLTHPLPHPVPELARSKHLDVRHPGENPARQFLATGGLQAELASRAKVEPAAKRRKRRKERESSSDEAAWAAGLAYPAQRILLDFELWGAKVDQQAVLNAR